MRRLEYARRVRSAPGRARNTAEAVMFLAAVARERHRLDQERNSLERRIARIDARLAVLAGTETKLVPAIQLVAQVQDPAAAAPSASSISGRICPQVSAQGVTSAGSRRRK